MRRPSKRAVLIGGSFFVLGFALAIALTAGFSMWLIRRSQSGLQANVVGNLTQSNGLLAVIDRSPDKLVPTILWEARQNTSIAAILFSRMSKRYQAMVLFEFKRMNDSTTLRKHRSPDADTARLARVMVLCTKASAQPDVIHVNPSMSMTLPVPSWVLDPNAVAQPPVANADASIEQTPTVLAAELKHWAQVHAWVKANQACIAKQGNLP